VSPALVRAQLGPRAKPRPLSDAAFERLIAAIGIERIWPVVIAELERCEARFVLANEATECAETQPRLPLQAAE
jgi:hypothetical protein